MLVRASLNYGAHLAAGLVFGAMAAALATQFAARMKRKSLSPDAPVESNTEERLS